LLVRCLSEFPPTGAITKREGLMVMNRTKATRRIATREAGVAGTVFSTHADVPDVRDAAEAEMGQMTAGSKAEALTCAWTVAVVVRQSRAQLAGRASDPFSQWQLSV
jgi:hypothetical protein